MSDTLNIFGTEYTGVTGIIATTPNETDLTYIRPQGTKSITSNGTGIDVSAYATADVSVQAPSPTLITKSITANGTYNASSDSADGYSSVTVSVSGSSPNLQAKTNISPTTSSQTIQADSGYDGLSSVQINAMPSMTLPSAASSTSSGTSKATITPTSSAQYLNIPTGYNGTAQYYTISAATASSKNVQISNSQVRLGNKTSLSDTGLTLTVSKTGTYNVYWSAFRTNTSSGYTWSTQLYIGSNAYGSANSSWSNSYNQVNKLTNVNLTKDQVLHIYGQTRSGSSYYVCCSNLIIEEVS